MIGNKKSQRLAEKQEELEEKLSESLGTTIIDDREVCSLDSKFQLQQLDQTTISQYDKLAQIVENEKLNLLMGYDAKQHYE